MEQMSLAQICKKYHFTRRVIQGYEKIGLIHHTGKNKYGYLMYDTDQVKKIAYIRYLQLNGFRLKEISKYLDNQSNLTDFAKILKNRNDAHKDEIEKISELIIKNERIIHICFNKEDFSIKEKEIMEIIIDELKKDSVIKDD